MRILLIMITVGGVFIAGCSRYSQDESTDKQAVLNEGRARLKETIETLSKDYYECDACFDRFSIIVRCLVKERNFGYKIDDLDSHKRVRRDIQYVIDLCSIAESECARVLDVIESNETKMEQYAAEQDYCGEYLKVRRGQYERKRCQIAHAAKAISNVRRAAFFYKRNRQFVKYDDGFIGFTDSGVQDEWENIVQTLDFAQMLLFQHHDSGLWFDHKKWYELDCSNAVYRCEKRLEHERQRVQAY